MFRIRCVSLTCFKSSFWSSDQFLVVGVAEVALLENAVSNEDEDGDWMSDCDEKAKEERKKALGDFGEDDVGDGRLHQGW